jgi:putative transposase
VANSVRDGCSQKKACEVLGISARTVQRWNLKPGEGDLRQGPKAIPANKLSDTERDQVVSVATSKEFCDKSPHQIVPSLADRGEYIASEASFYRILKARQMLTHRGRSKPKSRAKPKALEATRPRQLFSWDITYLKTIIQGQYFYLYMFLDVYSRKIVGWEVHNTESADCSSRLLQKICVSEKIESDGLVVHADNGSPMKGATMLITMQKLGILPSFSRPSVSDDNPFSEALFKTLKYCPQYPSQPFETISAAQEWVSAFVIWYNNEHLHSAISFTTPNSRHTGNDAAILKNRAEVYEEAKRNRPARWSRSTRKWERVEQVRLNWLKDIEGSDRKENLQSVSCF